MAEEIPAPEGPDYTFGIPVENRPVAAKAPSPPKPVAEPAAVVSSNGAHPDSDYFYLSSPISVDGREFTRLLMNPKGVLKGRSFFTLIDKYQRKFPDEARTNFNKFTSENFLSLVLAEINKIAPEDLYKCAYEDLPLLFLQSASFHFSGGAPRAATPEEAAKTP
jgi:hypothetical protein